MLRSAYMTNVRNAMDATNSARWSDTEVVTALGVVSGEEWQGILGANPFYRFAQRAVTTDSNGQFTYAGLDSGSGDTAQNFYRILAITDGNSIAYRQTEFLSVPLATSSNSSSVLLPYEALWYDAGDHVQILPVSTGLALTVTINHTPPTIDSLSDDSVAVEFPSGHEAVIWLGAAAFLLEKGGAEADAAQILRASQAARRNLLYQQISRRGGQPLLLQYPDRAAEWGSV